MNNPSINFLTHYAWSPALAGLVSIAYVLVSPTPVGLIAHCITAYKVTMSSTQQRSSHGTQGSGNRVWTHYPGVRTVLRLSMPSALAGFMAEHGRGVVTGIGHTTLLGDAFHIVTMSSTHQRGSHGTWRGVVTGFGHTPPRFRVTKKTCIPHSDHVIDASALFSWHMERKW